ncbi:MAG: hypothetical protein J0M18_21785 [Ignavibacteria bacterium]|nr:hypothetical protein [Ignavibacteria bacterium]
MSILGIINGSQNPNNEDSLRRELIKFDDKYEFYKAEYRRVNSEYQELRTSVNGNNDQFTDEQLVRFEKLGDELSELIEVLEHEEDERETLIMLWHDKHDY